MNKSNIFGIGTSGLVGSRIVELLSERYSFTNLGTATGVDITKPETLRVLEEDHDHSVVLHLAAKADVDECEKDKELGEAGEAWNINVNGTENVVNACKALGKKLIYISTDFVFDGTKPLGETYTENDTPNPLNWYAQTKYEGEKIVQKSGLPYLILRISYPYRLPFEGKKDLVQAMLSRLQAGKSILAVTDHFMTPTLVDDIAEAIDTLIQTKSEGIYHVTGSQVLSPCELAKRIARIFSLDSSLISETTRNEFFTNRAPRPFNLAMNNDRIKKLGVNMRTVEEGLLELNRQANLG